MAHFYPLTSTMSHIYIAGTTRAINFPTTYGAYDTSLNTGDSKGAWYRDGFVSKFDRDLNNLWASTLLGGSEEDRVISIILDEGGNLYAAGVTGSADFPVTPEAYDTSYNGGYLGYDVFVLKLDSNLNTLLASTFVGGKDDELLTSVALDTTGNVYVVGGTRSTDFPTTQGAYDTTHTGGYKIFVSKLSHDLLVYQISGNLEVSPSSHDFGEVAVGLCAATPQQFTITNTGNAELTVTGITLSDTENFELSINTLPCEKTYTSGESCSFDVYFCPKTSGDLSASMTITSNDPDTPTLNLPLTGLAQCNPLNNVYFIGDYAGLYEGKIDNKDVDNDCCTVVETDIQAATLIDICIPGFPCIKKGVEFWTSIEEIDFDPNVASYQSSTHDVTGGLLADWKLIPPGMHASYEVTFCKPGTVTFELGFSEKAIGITIADVMTSIIPFVGDIPYSTIIDFYDDLSDILLVSSAINHESSAMNAALSGNMRLALSETVKARIDLLNLIFNRTQMNQLLQAYVALVENLKLDITDNELQKLILKKWGTTIPIKVLKSFQMQLFWSFKLKGEPLDLFKLNL